MENFDTEVSAKLKEAFRAEDIASAAKKDALEAEAYARQLRMEIKELMEAQGVLTMETDGFVLSVKRKAPGVIIQDESKLPEYVFETIRKVDLSKLKKAIGSGAPIEGAVMSNGGGTTIAIRAKQ